MSSGTHVEQKSDPYTVREGGAAPPPTSWRQRLRYLGPSVVISGAIVGSGEMVLTSGLGAAAGFVMLWWVLLSCWIKSLIQAELARYTLVSGDTYVRAMNRLPFRIRIGRGHVSFAVAITLIALVPALLGMGGIIGGAGQALTLLVSGRAVDPRRRTAGRDHHCRPDHGLLPDPGERDACAGHDLHRRHARLRDPDAGHGVRRHPGRTRVRLHVQLSARVHRRRHGRLRLLGRQLRGNLRLPVLVRREGLPELHRQAATRRDGKRAPVAGSRSCRRTSGSRWSC